MVSKGTDVNIVKKLPNNLRWWWVVPFVDIYICVYVYACMSHYSLNCVYHNYEQASCWVLFAIEC